MHERIDGQLNDLNQQQSFEVVSIREPTLPGGTQAQRIEFQAQVSEMRRAVGGTLKSLEETLAEIGAIKDTLQHSTANMRLYSDALSIERGIIGQRDRLSGNQTRGEFSVNRPVPINSRLSHAAYSPNTSAHAPTETQRNSLRIAQNIYGEINLELTHLVDVEYAALRRSLDDASVPWTPGRGIVRPN
jgi:hypothetical protein